MQSLSTRSQPKMSLRAKTLLMVSFTALVLIIILNVATKTMLLQGFMQVEERNAAANLERMLQALDMRGNQVATLVQDWSQWDDLYNYAKNPSANQAFADANLSASMFSSTKADLVVIVNDKLELVNEAQYDKENDTKAKVDKKILDYLLSTNNYFVHELNEKDGRRGLFFSSTEPMLISIKKILNSKGEGPSSGYLFMGKFIDAKVIDNLKEVTRLDMTMQNASNAAFTSDFQTAFSNITKNKSDRYLVYRTENEINGYTLLNDVFQNPAFILKYSADRPIFQQGVATLRMLQKFLIGMSLAFIIVVLLQLEFSVLKRLKNLSGIVRKIEKENNLDLRATDAKNDELGDLSKSFNGMVATIQKNAKSMKDILDNVKFGFFTANITGAVECGYSKSCEELLGTESICGKQLGELLKMNARDNSNFLSLYSQIYEDILPEELSLEQLPTRFEFGNRILQMTGSIIRDKQNKVSAVLFCLIDITKLELVERENQNNRVLLKILNSRQTFTDLLIETRQNLAQIISFAKMGDERSVRRLFHTLKGNYGFFGLRTVSQYIHEIESEDHIPNEACFTVEKYIREFLEANQDVLEMSFDLEKEGFLKIKETDLANLQNIAKKNTTDAKWLAEKVLHFCHESRMRSLQEISAPLKGIVEQVALRVSKKVDFKINSNGFLVRDEEIKPFISVLPHMLRNSVDHGIESEYERGEKNPIGSLILEFQQQPNSKNLRVIVEDDGRGLDLNKIKERASAQKLLDNATLDSMRDEEIYSIIFKDTFTTAENVTEISGRGVGMGAVEQVVTNLGGNIKLQNRPGKGLKFEIDLGIECLAEAEKTFACLDKVIKAETDNYDASRFAKAA